MLLSGDSLKGNSPGFQGIRFTFTRFSGPSTFTWRRASSGVSFTPPSITYSKVRCSQWRSGYLRHASISASSGYFLLIGISTLRCSSFEAFNEIASFGRTSSFAIRSIPGTIPLVDSVTRLGESPTPSSSSRIASAPKVFSKFSSGSPCPINTTFVRAANSFSSPFAFLHFRQWQQHLRDNLAGAQIADQPQLRREAELTIDRTSSLRRNANRLPTLARHEHRFHGRGFAPCLVFLRAEAEEIAHGPVRRYISLPHRGQRDAGLGRQLLSQRRRETGHPRQVEIPLGIQRVINLRAAISRLPKRLAIGAKLLPSFPEQFHGLDLPRAILSSSGPVRPSRPGPAGARPAFFYP